MVTYAIRGMTCQHCVRAVTRALEKLPGVKRVEVSLERASASIEGEPADAAVLAAVADEGYEASRM